MKQIIRKLHGNILVLAKIGAALNQIARLASPERPLVHFV
jgi:hypothetical protein